MRRDSHPSAGVAARHVRRGGRRVELLVLAVLGVAVEEAIEQAGAERFGGKVVIDATGDSPLRRRRPPRRRQPPRMSDRIRGG